MATSHDGQLTFDEVLERVLTADPQSFYTQANFFEEAARSLHDAKDLLTKHRRGLEEAWSNRADQRFVQLDGLVRHLEVLLGDVPTYPGKLRRIGDAIVDSRQRLLELRHVSADADSHAVSDRDKQARKILDDLSGTYRQVGGEMPELPERAATGQMLPVPPPRHGVAVGGGSGGGVGCTPAAAPKSAHSLMSRSTSPTGHTPAEETVGAPAPQAAFGRFAQYATRPAAGHAPVQKARSFNSFARLVDQADPAALAMRPNGVSLVAADATGQRERRHAETTEVPVDLDRSTKLSTVDAAAPAKLESSPAAAAPSPESPTTPASAPAASTGSAPAPVARPQISLMSNSSLASVLTTPAVLVASPPPAHPAPTASPVTPGPQPNPLAMPANANLAPDAASGANMMRPAFGSAVPSGVSGSVGRGAEVWLRTDGAEWTTVPPVVDEPDRDDTCDHRLGFNGDKSATEHGKDAR